MTSQEMSKEFNIVFESVASMNAPGYTEYEKSILLTQAEYDITIETAQVASDTNDYARTILAKLLTPYTGLGAPTQATNVFGNTNTVRAYTITLSTTLGLEFFYPFVEFAVTGSGGTAYERACKPIDYNTYYTSLSNPYAKPYVDLYWRLYDGDHLTIITDGTALTTPYLKGLYVKKPTPIITTAAAPAFTIDGYLNTDGVKNSQLNEIIHREIVYRAAMKAYAAMKDQAGYQLQNAEQQEN